MPDRVDFSSHAGVYDRRHGAVISGDGLDRLSKAAGLQAGVRVVDIGAGTGRVAIPLARLSCRVVAVEPAPGMLAELAAKASNTDVHAVSAEGARLPFVGQRFDVAVIARLLYLTPDWRVVLDEARCVLRPGGRLLHEWGNGQSDEEWVQIRDEARRLFEAAGCAEPFHPGVRAESLVDGHILGLGFERYSQLNLGPGPLITLQEFLRRLCEGELSYIWKVPERVRAECLPRLRAWAEQTFDLERPTAMPRELVWTIYRKVDVASAMITT